MMTQPEPRARQRKEWAVDTHLGQLDTDIDTLESSVNAGFERLATQLERNRQTMWKVLTVVIAVAGLILTGIGLVVGRG